MENITKFVVQKPDMKKLMTGWIWLEFFVPDLIKIDIIFIFVRKI